MSSAPAETRPDGLLGGRLALFQPSRGHRAGTDAVLLAAAAGAEPGDVVVDVGSGVGTVGLIVALNETGAQVHLLEREAELAALAERNAALNGCAERVVVHRGDLATDETVAGLRGRASLALSNPPFHLAGATRASPDALRARAHGLEGAVATTQAWLIRLTTLLRPGGRAVMIHVPSALPALLEAARGRLGGLHIRPVQPRVDRPAHRILIGGTLGSRAPLVVLPPLVLHEGAAFTPLADSLHRGEATLPLLPQRKRRPEGRLVPDPT